MSARRLEYKDDRSYKFWEISVEANTHTVRYGKVGTAGTSQTKSFPTPDKATADADKLLKSKLRKGYVEVASTATPSSKSNTRPADSKADWSVRADELQAAGDPWGQRIALWIARDAAKGNDKRKLTKELDALDEQHGEHFYGAALLELMGQQDFDKAARLTWEYGYIVRARIGRPEWDFDGPDARDVLRAVVQAPAAKQLRELTVGLYDFEGSGIDGVGSDIASGGELPELRKLFLGDFSREEQEISWVEIGELDPLYPLTPKLETLRLRGASIKLGALEHPTLARLEIETGGLPRESVASIAAAKLPELAHMEVWFGQTGYGGTTDIEALRPLFSSTTLPKLRHLGLQNSEMQDEIARELCNSPLLAQVESVDLSMGTMREPGAQALLANASSFKHLRSLNLSDNFIPSELAGRLRASLGSLLQLGHQQQAEEYRGERYYYTQVGE